MIKLITSTERFPKRNMADLIFRSKGYQDLLARLKTQIRTAQVRAAAAVNQQLVLLYWEIGKEILTRQRQDGWGTKVIERLAKDLRSEFPEMQGLSARNPGYNCPGVTTSDFWSS